MKTKYPSIFGLVAALILVASFVVPTNLMSPEPVEAGVCVWDNLMTPGYLPLKNDITAGYEKLDMAIGGDGRTIWLTERATVSCAAAQVLGEPFASWCTNPVGCRVNQLYYSNNNGISFTGSKTLNLVREILRIFGAWNGHQVYHVAVAPDNPNFVAVTADNPNDAAGGGGPVEVWISANAGGTWEVTNLRNTMEAGELIRDIDISIDYGGRRDIAVATIDGAGGGDVYVVKSTGFTGWIDQQFDATPMGDFYALKFSPTYAGDASLALVFADATSTWYNISQRDIDGNQHASWTFLPIPGVEVRDPTWTAGASPEIATLNKAVLELPSDFSGQAASLRRAYISLDSWGAPNKGLHTAAGAADGIFRADDSLIYTLMDTSNVVNKSIYSIAYFGTYASGKLLAGERMGDPCTATVPTWFTDSPTTCPIPCWYPALKPTTGAACGAATACTFPGRGGANVGWTADGSLAFAATGCLPLITAGDFSNPWETGVTCAYDESAFAVSRNNGETWNQIAFIDTKIHKFTDIAPTPDCKTIYLASINRTAACCGFDSVWRTSNNAEVVSPYPPLPLGIFWERILTRLTGDNCTGDQTNYALLRIVPYCADPTGQIVGWGVWDPNMMFRRGIAMWSPDYGDYWANINPRRPIQDFAFESKTVLYFLSPGGLVQKMPYTGTAWSTTMPDIDTILLGAHTIAAYPEGKVLVGASAAQHAMLYAASFSGNFNTDNPSFSVMSLAGTTQYLGNVHVAFDPKFKDNNTVFIADDDTFVDGGSVYRNSVAVQERWIDNDMMASASGAVGCAAPHPVGQYGIVLAFTGEALYSAHNWGGFDGGGLPVLPGVCRTVDDGTGAYGPLSGMPKPGIAWDCLTTGLETGVTEMDAPCNVDFEDTWPEFTLEPSSLKACGCCTLDTDTTLYAIDNNDYAARTTILEEPCCPPGAPCPYCALVKGGLVWSFTDCMAKKGPKLITADKALIGCDPVSGRAQEVNLCWEQLCVADAYDIEIAKNADFSLRIIDFTEEGNSGILAYLCHAMRPVDVLKPCVFFPAGGAAMSEFIKGQIGKIEVPFPLLDEMIGTQLGQLRMSTPSLAAFANLECGHTYYWRVKVRECATGQWARSPWSEVRSFTVKAGLPVTTPYYGPQLLAPNNGCLACPVKPASFSWSPFKETTKYKFQLAKDAAMTQIVKETDVTTTAYEFDGTLDYSSNYFWRIMSLEPAPSDWSATFSFQTEAAPAPPAEPAGPPPTPLWVWVVIAIGAILVIVTLVLIFKTRRV